jgi:transcriptional regulator with XRE-family HTH domain
MPLKRGRFAARRRAVGFSQEQLADRLGVDRSTVARWESGETEPQPWIRPRLARTLQVSVEQLHELLADGGLIESEAIEPLNSTLTHQGSVDLDKQHVQLPLTVLPAHGFSGVHPAFRQTDILPVLKNMSQASTVPVIAALREMRNGYVLADRLMGGLSVSNAVRTQIPVVVRACEVTRGKDRAEALDFACRFMEFSGWIHQDAGDLSCAIFWTDRALDYAMELGDQRTIAYTLMRKSAIATEAGNPAQGLGIANSALANRESLTPRLRAVILRQCAQANASLRETVGMERDADNALSEAITGVGQEEEDRAPYCSPMYIAMETGQSMAVTGQSKIALSVLERSRAEWADRSQVRDYALCVSRLATAYAVAGHPDKAREIAAEAISLAYGIGSHRVIGQLSTLSGILGRWANDPLITATRERLSTLAGSFQQ